MKKLTIRQMAAVKNIAKNVNPLVTTKNRLIKKISELYEEVQNISQQIEGHEGGVKALTGGLTSEYLVKKVISENGKFDKNGKPLKETKYVTTDNVVFNEEERCYYIQEIETGKESCENTEETENVEYVEEASEDIESIDNPQSIPDSSYTVGAFEDLK